MKRITEEEGLNLRKLDYWEVKYVKPIAFSLSDYDAEGFQTVTYYGESLKDLINSSKKPEWVYVLANQSIPGILKIGYTTTSIPQRTREINSSTGVITPWFPVFGYKCASGYMLEQEIHRYLENLGIRVNPNREGFEIDIDTAIEIIEDLGKKYTIL
jgi:hypothetical protein